MSGFLEEGCWEIDEGGGEVWWKQKMHVEVMSDIGGVEFVTRGNLDTVKYSADMH